MLKFNFNKFKILFIFLVFNLNFIKSGNNKSQEEQINKIANYVKQNWKDSSDWDSKKLQNLVPRSSELFQKLNSELSDAKKDNLITAFQKIDEINKNNNLKLEDKLEFQNQIQVVKGLLLIN